MQEKGASAFEVGAKVIYPTHGLGVIEKIETRKFSGVDSAFYVIRIKKKGMTIMAPINSANQVGVRTIIPKRDVPKVIDILKDGEAECHEPNWNKRQKTYQEKIKSGSLFEVATVFKTLFTLKESKGLSFVEQQVFENAYQLIVTELAEAKGVGEDKAMKIVDKALSC